MTTKEDPIPFPPSLQSREAFEAAVNEAAALQVRRDLAKARLNEELQRVRDTYGAPVAELEAAYNRVCAQCEHYAHHHRQEVFEQGKKSGSTRLATYKFRDRPVSLVCASKKKDAWSAVLEKLHRLGLTVFIRTVEEVDKNTIKECATDEQLRQLGLRKTGGEAFSVTPKDTLKEQLQ
jgi:phage host-nuclease inhibitor protein Gam